MVPRTVCASSRSRCWVAFRACSAFAAARIATPAVSRKACIVPSWLALRFLSARLSACATDARFFPPNMSGCREYGSKARDMYGS